MKSPFFVLAVVGLAGPALADFPSLQLKPVAIGQFFSPTTVTHAGDGSGRLFITDQRGKIHIFANGAVLPVPFLDLSAKLVSERAGFDERGLLGLAFHPDYEVDGAAGEGKFYAFYSANSPNAPGTATDPVDCRSVIAEYQVSANPDVADPLSERVLLAFDKPQFNHNGGALAFGPVDKLLYISTGDGGGSNDNDPGHTGGTSLKPSGALGNAQDRTNLLGKILRIDPFGTNGPGGQYGIPASNPFVGAGGGIHEEIYAYGLRNPWRFSFDDGPGGTNRLFLADVGQGKFEEIDLITSGGNYGWRRFEGFEDFDASTPSSGPYVAPVAAYAHPGQAGATGLLEVGLSVTGGHVYRGSAIPALVGKYVFGDWSTSFGTPNGTLLGLEEGTPGSFTLSKLNLVGGNPIGRYIPAFGVDEAGEIYVATKTTLAPSTPEPGGAPSGQLFKIVPAEVSATLSADRDNSIYSDQTGNSNGQGELFAGLVANETGIRRALVRFDLSPVPAGSTVQSATVKLTVTRAGPTPGGSFTLHRLTRDWGEGTSSGIGLGAPASPGEATWLQAKFGIEAWTTPGGDFVTTASASQSVNALGSYAWASAGLAADVQMWLAQPASRHGWLLRGPEGVGSAKAFASRETGGVSTVPSLELTYLAPVTFTRRETWEAQFFPAGTFLDPQGDSDQDRIPMIFEYGWDLNPGTKQALADFLDIDIDVAGGVANVVFRRDPRATDLEYRLETSTNLGFWVPAVVSTGGGAPTGSAFVSEAADPANTATLRVVAAIPLAPGIDPKRFIRLNIRRP
jgi:glucose/arabinose dehydrogenase